MLQKKLEASKFSQKIRNQLLYNFLRQVGKEKACHLRLEERTFKKQLMKVSNRKINSVETILKMVLKQATKVNQLLMSGRLNHPHLVYHKNNWHQTVHLKGKNQLPTNGELQLPLQRNNQSREDEIMYKAKYIKI